jgi:transposase
MRVQQFQAMVRGPSSAWRALRQRRWPHASGLGIRCPSCNTRWPYLLDEGRWRCRRRVCSYTFGVRTGTWAGLSRVPDVTWLWLVKLFELELTARQAALQTGVSYPTAHKAFLLLRRAILVDAEPTLFRREVEADESYFGPRHPKRSRGHPKNMGRSAPHRQPVFGILERRGRVQVSVVPNCSQRVLQDHTLKWVKRGTLVYTDKWAGYDALACCGYEHLRLDHARHFSRGRVHINGLEGFWSYAKAKFQKHHGVSPAKFPLYLYEWQFRYNHRDEDLFQLFLVQSLKLLPNL